MERQTDLSLEQLKDLIKNNNFISIDCKNCNCGSLDITAQKKPLCLIVNEIGVILLLEKNNEAVPVLVELLSYEDMGTRFASYCYLKKTCQHTLLYVYCNYLILFIAITI